MHTLPKTLLTLALLTGLAACQTPPANTVTGQGQKLAKDTISFLDYSGFDHELSQALNQSEPVVTVLLHDKVSPNNTPDRLQKWLNAVDRNGGKVEVETPANELTPRSPFAIISLLGGLWNAIKVTTELRDRQLTQSVRGHDAVISLERNPEGQMVISKIRFKKSP